MKIERVRSAPPGWMVLLCAQLYSCGGGPEEPVGEAESALAAVVLSMPSQPLFLASYAKIPVAIDPTSGITFDDLAFEVAPSTALASVSWSKDSTFNPAQPSVLLLAGPKVGTGYTLRAKLAATGAILATGTFAVSENPAVSLPASRWYAKMDGLAGNIESFWVNGTPQNYNVFPANGTRRVAVVFLQAPNSPNYQAWDQSLILQRWTGATQAGLVSDQTGIAESVKRWMREVSLHPAGPSPFDMVFTYFGPFNLPEAGTSYLGVNVGPVDSAWQRFVAACDAAVDFRQFDHVLFIHNVAIPTQPSAEVFPRTLKVDDGGGIDRSLFVSQIDGRTPSSGAVAVATHELSHNLGYTDLYSPFLNHPSNLGGWDMMHGSNTHPFVSAGSRLLTGWMAPEWVETINWQASATATDRTVVLHPAELGPPPAGRKQAVEVRLADGRNYYFEYRLAQANQAGDRQLPTNDRILGVDFESYQNAEQVNQQAGRRPFAWLLPASNGAGPVLNVGQEYRESDSLDPMWPAIFSATFTQRTGNSATIRVQADPNMRPDPSVHYGEIEVSNALTQILGPTDPTYRNVPVAGIPNTVSAFVTNRGNVNAPNVTVMFAAKWTAGTAWTPLGQTTLNVNAGQRIKFTAPTGWVPPAGDRSYMVAADIVPYTTPAMEMRDRNNRVVWVYSRVISGTASPSSRKRVQVPIANPLNVAATITAALYQSNPLYRSYLDKTVIPLGVGQEATLTVMSEFAGQEFLASGGSQATYDTFRNLTNQISVRTTIRETGLTTEEVPRPLGNARIVISEGLATDCIQTYAQNQGGSVLLTGNVKVRRTAANAPSSTMIVSLRGASGATTVNTPVVNGAFSVLVTGSGWTEVQGYYVPTPGHADCQTPVLPHP